jgi:hypothetical protein
MRDIISAGSKRAGTASRIGSLGSFDLTEVVDGFEPRRRAKYQSSFSVFVIGKRKYEFSGGLAFRAASLGSRDSGSIWGLSVGLSGSFLDRQMAFGLRKRISSSS